MDALIHKYRLPSKRSGLLLEIRREEESSFGEISPLPGWSVESFEEAHTQLKEVQEALIRNKPLPASLLPSVAFGVEAALREKESARVPVAAFLTGSAKEIKERASRCIQEGFTHAKVKIAHLDEKDARAILHELKGALRLRVDLNRAWPLKKALQFFSEFNKEDFDFIEEPVDNPQDLLHFPLPIGVDETLREEPLDFILKIPMLKAFVFKPTLHGSIEKAKALLKHKIDLVLSSSHESGIGVAHIALLSKQLAEKLPPLGIGTYESQGDLLSQPLLYENGELLVNSDALYPKLEYLYEYALSN